jgi:hypothetical protein
LSDLSEVTNEVYTFVVDDQDQSQINAEVKKLSGQLHHARCVPDTKKNRYIMWMKKDNCSVSVTIVRNWLLHLGLSTHLLVLHSGFSGIITFITLRMVFVPA